MSVRTIHDQKDTVYFITITCYKWLPLIERTDLYDFIYSWFKRVNKVGIKILGYVIMPNHLHLIIYYPKVEKNLNQEIGEAKRFMAYEIIKRLRKNHDHKMLFLLDDNVSDKERQNGQKHRVFMHSFDAKIIESKSLIEQKLNYIHANPVSGKWNLAEDFTKYPHSSAGYYELDEKSEIALTHYCDVVG